MCKPDDRKDRAGNPDAIPCHHEKSESHQQRHGAYDRDLGRPQHAAIFHKGVQMLFIQTCFQEPIVQLLRTVGEEEDSQKIEWRRGQDRQEHTHCAKTQANTAKRGKNVIFDFHIFFILRFSTIVEMTCRIAVTGW